MMTRALSAVLIAVVILAMVGIALSCSRGTPPTSEPVDLGEKGTWNWVMSIGGMAGDTIYADSVDFTRQLVFFDISDTTFFQYYHNGFLEVAGRYALVPPSDSQSNWVVLFDDTQLPSRIIDRLDADTLVLSPLTTIDTYTDFYSRVAAE